MLRRKSVAEAVAAAEGLDSQAADVSESGPEIERRMGERRKLDRRDLDAWRNDLDWSEGEGRSYGSVKVKGSGFDIKPAQVLMIMLAVVAAAIAAFFAMQRDVLISEPVTQTRIVEEPKVPILVARQEVGIGQRLSSDLMGWEMWPEGSVRPEFITEAVMPDAVGHLSGTVVRHAFFPGEPIRQSKLATLEGGFLSAVVAEGMRGVSIPVAAEAASGGFINPNDRVDILLTREGPAGANSETILRNVRVLAINKQLGDVGNNPETGGNQPDQVPGAGFNGGAIATLELDPARAEVVVAATGAGRLSLVLRSVSDFDEVETPGRDGINEAIRLSSPFWRN